MTDTTPEIHFKTGAYNFLKNRTVAELLYRNLQWAKAPLFTDEEKVFARGLQKELGVKEQGLDETIKPLQEPEKVVSGGSTDVADVSWVVPTASLGVACYPMEIPGHHWGVVSCTGSSLGFKGMRTAAKVIAASAIEALTDGRIIARAQKEFKEKTRGFVYRSAIPAEQKPPVKKKGK